MFFLPRRKRSPLSRSVRRPLARPVLEVLEGRWAPAVLTVTTAADSGPGSLRQAILDSDNPPNSPVLNIINFSIGSGPQTIALASRLPEVVHPVIIDATTQPGYAGTPLITLDGSGAGPADGLDVPADYSAVRGLTITHFAGSGVAVYSDGNTALQTDFLVGNGLDGVTITGGNADPSAVGGCLISGNGRCGILLLGFDTCIIQGNRIGTNEAGTAAMPNALDGISDSASGATISGSIISGNLISGNGRSGVTIFSGRPDVLTGNNIGTNADGTAAISNGADGVSIVGGKPGPLTVHVGGSTPADGNLISGNGRSGVYVGAGGGATVENCRIGVNAAGEAALGNAADGVTCDGAGAGIYSSVLSGNGRVGVLVGGPGSGAEIDGDDIGTNAAGTAALGNGIGGVFAYQGGQVNLRDLPPDASGPVPDVISGNGGNGVTVIGAANQLSNVTDCRIGTNAAGTAALPNSDDGIALLDGVTNFTVVDSIISGNAGNGVSLTGSATTLNLIENQNKIGVAANGSALGNGGNGVLITGGAHDNIVGGRIGPNTGTPGNEIAFNGGDGVDIVSGVGDAVLGNSIHDNSGLGIDLGGNGVTPNDSAGHTGPNHYQNFPVITAVAPGNGGGTDITFTLDSVPSTTFRVEFFANDTPDPSGHGEGQTYLGEADVTTDGSGHFAGTRNVAGTVSAGQEVAATATNPAVGTSTTPYGDTSEFSANFPPPL